jgi:hypothetical protein
MNATPVAPDKDAHQAAYLYANKGSSNSGLGVVFAHLDHRWSFPVIAVGAVLMAIVSLANSHQTNTKREAAQAQADMVVFNKSSASMGFERTCLQTAIERVPSQFYQDCKDVQAAAKVKRAKQ